MKKRLSIIIAVILIIALVIFVKTKIIGGKFEYKLEEVQAFTYVKYREGNSFGVMDRDGNKIVDAKYESIVIPNPEKDIFVCYESEERTVVLNSKAEELFTKYDKIEPIKIKNTATVLCYEKSVLKYKKGENYGLISFSGKELTKNEYSSIENLLSTEGKFLVSKDGKFVVINIKGAKLVPVKFDNIITDGYYNDETKYSKAGFIVSETTNDGYRYGYINYKGKVILDTKYNDLLRVTTNSQEYLIAAINGQYGFYKGKKEIIKPEYQSISYTDNGAIIIERNGVYGIASLKGEIKIAPKYTQIAQNGEYLYAQNSTETDVYNSDGEKLDINFNKTVYGTENKDYNITTLVNNDVTYYGIENKDGKTLVETRYSYIEYVFDNHFIAENQDGKYGVINSDGKEAIEFNYDLLQKIKDKNILRAGNVKSEKESFFSKDLEEIVNLKDAKVESNINYIKIYNDESKIYVDNDGNKVEEDSDTVKKSAQNELPEAIGDYKKVQYSLDDAYYEK